MKVAFIVRDKTTSNGYEGECALVIAHTETDILIHTPATWHIDTIVDTDVKPGHVQFTKMKAEFS